MNCASRTSKLCRGGNLAEKLNEVWQVVTEELGLKHEVLAGVERLELGSEKL
jgi:hypothetical protein